MSDIMRHPSSTMQAAQPVGISNFSFSSPSPYSSGESARASQSQQDCEETGVNENYKGTNLGSKGAASGACQENQGILKRIQNAQPQYSHVEWEQSFRQNRSYLRNCCDLPFVLESPRRPQHGDSMMQSLSVRSEESHLGAMEPAADGSELRPVFKEGQKLGAGWGGVTETSWGNCGMDYRYYLVEMFTDGRALTISAYDGESQRALELLINERNHRRL